MPNLWQWLVKHVIENLKQPEMIDLAEDWSLVSCGPARIAIVFDTSRGFPLLKIQLRGTNLITNGILCEAFASTFTPTLVP